MSACNTFNINIFEWRAMTNPAYGFEISSLKISLILSSQKRQIIIFIFKRFWIYDIYVVNSFTKNNKLILLYYKFRVKKSYASQVPSSTKTLKIQKLRDCYRGLDMNITTFFFNHVWFYWVQHNIMDENIEIISDSLRFFLFLSVFFFLLHILRF